MGISKRGIACHCEGFFRSNLLDISKGIASGKNALAMTDTLSPIIMNHLDDVIEDYARY